MTRIVMFMCPPWLRPGPKARRAYARRAIVPDPATESQPPERRQT